MSDGDDPVEGQTDEADGDAGLEQLLEKLSTEHNFDFREYKRASLARRIRVRMQHVRADSFERYADYLARYPQEHVALFNTILINVTGFFRDPPAWQVLAQDVLPRLVREASEMRSLRVWCVGASSGEEAYSVAVLLAEHLGDRARDFNIKIYATDVDEEALATARQALYRLEDVKDVPTTLLDRYFARDGQAYRFRRDVRHWVIFGRHNVAQDPPLSHMDLLVCRNVLIYFTSDLQDRILARFQYAIREGGAMFLGRSESLLARSRSFVPHNVKWRIFQRTNTPGPTVAAGMMRGAQEVPVTNPSPNRAASGDSGVLLHRLVDSLTIAVMVIDGEDTVLVWNSNAAALYDIPAESALGRKFRDLDISYRIENLRARVEEVKANRAPARLDDVRFGRRSGDMVHANITIAPLLDGSRALGVVVCALEATESARLREQMSRVAEQHATAIEELQSTNEELETTNEELQSTNEELETTNEELQSTNEELETTVEELQAANTELATLNAELELRSAQLRTLDDYQRAVLASLNHVVITVDRDGVVTTWNQAAEQMWGMRRDHVVGRSLWSLPIGDMTRQMRAPVAHVIESGEAAMVEDVPFIVDGETRRTALRLSPLRDGGGSVTGVVLVSFQDVPAS